MKRRLFLCLVWGFLMLFMNAPTGVASSPDEWERFYKEVAAKCTKTSGLMKARVIGESFSTGDDAFEVILIRGLHTEPARKNGEGNSLCLFDKAKKKCECTEVDQWFSPGKR